jgi:hypothetical protein
VANDSRGRWRCGGKLFLGHRRQPVSLVSLMYSLYIYITCLCEWYMSNVIL